MMTGSLVNYTYIQGKLCTYMYRQGRKLLRSLKAMDIDVRDVIYTCESVQGGAYSSGVNQSESSGMIRLNLSQTFRYGDSPIRAHRHA